MERIAQMTQSPVEFSGETSVGTVKPSPILVLLVDDDACFLKTSKQCLETQGHFQIDTASSVDEAMGKMEKAKYDVVVSDYQMPGKNGLQFLKELREKDNIVPFIIFTGRGREEIAIRALNLGAEGYFNKSGGPETVYGELAHGVLQVVGKRRAEYLFLKVEDKYRRLVETLREGIWVIGKDSRTTFVNPRMAEILGYDIEEMKGRHLFSFMDEHGVEIAKRLLERRKQGLKEQHDFEFLRKDGTRIYATLETSPITDDNGNYSGALASVMDITESKKAEEELKLSEQRFRCLVENTLVGITTVDTKGRLTYLNRATADMFGYSGSEMLGQPFNSFLHPDDKGKIMRLFLKLILLRREPRLLEFRGVRKDGHVINLMSKPTRFVLDGKTVGFQAIILDVSKSRKAEKEDLMQKERAQEYLNIIGNIVVALDSNGRIIVLNKKGHEILGYEERKLLGKDWFETCILKESREQAVEVFKACMQGKLEMAQHQENPILTKNGEKRIVSWYNTVLKDDDGKIIGMLSSGEDITECKKAEKSAEESRKKLDVVNEKLLAVGGLTRHDVRNKLSMIVGNVYLSKKKLADNPEILENLEDIESGCNQIVKILDFAKAYEMLGVEELTYVKVEEAVQEAVSLFSDLKAAKVRNECKGLTVLADSLLRQLFYNLIDNSLKHGKKVRQIRINYEIDGDRLRLFYEDDGVGLPPEAKARIFQQGYTTGMGTGFGLYLIKKITEVYGWTIEENGKTGKGARFVMTIPKTSPNVKENYRIPTQ